MIIDCDRCEMRNVSCGDCVMSVLLGAPRDVEIDPTEQAAIAALAEGGLVPPLRLVLPDTAAG